MPAGTVVGSRFTLERVLSTDSLGSVYFARENNTKRPVSIRVIDGAFVAAKPALDALLADVREAATLDHRNILVIFGMGQVGEGMWFIAGERVDGEPLDELIAGRKAEDEPNVSVRNTFAVIEGIAAALAGAAAKMSHGALRPSVVWMSKSGRVRVGDFGIAKAILRTSGARALGPVEQGYLAPEVKRGEPATAASDVFGLAAIAYTLLTGRSPTDAFVMPSSVHPHATAELDAVLLRALSVAPADRFPSARAFVDALAPLAQAAPAAPADELRVATVESERPLAPAPERAPSAPNGVGRRVAANAQFRDVTPAPAPNTLLALSGGDEAPALDLSTAVARATEDVVPRWMVVKDGLDHGPFSGRELVAEIAAGRVLGEHGLLNLDTGARSKIGESPAFSAIVSEASKTLRKREEVHAVTHLEKRDRAGNAAKAAVLGAFVLVLAAGVGMFLNSRKNAENEQADSQTATDLYARGQLRVEGSAGILPAPPPRRASGGSKSGGGGAPRGGSIMSYEDAMNQPVELGDVSEGGGSMRQLTRDQVAGALNPHLNSLASCVGSERLGRVTIDLAILGSGQVLGASVRPGSPGVQSCIAGRLRNVRFPSFPAPRMGARYAFDAD